MNNESIGIFDSGVGGLTVLKEISNMLPGENIIYLGDTARVPYGIRSPEVVTRYSFECTEFLLKQNIKLLVVACNTVSAISLDKICEKISIPVIGVIEPGAEAAVNSTKNKKIGVIGTEATIKSSAYSKAIKVLDGGIEVFGLSPRLFVPLVEEGWIDGMITKLIVEKYLKNLRDTGMDTLVLGCTHYPLLKPVIQEEMGSVCLIDSAIETAKVVKTTMIENCMLRESEDLPTKKFVVTDFPDRFISVGERFLQQKIKDIEKIEL